MKNRVIFGSCFAMTLWFVVPWAFAEAPVVDVTSPSAQNGQQVEDQTAVAGDASVALEPSTKGVAPAVSLPTQASSLTVAQRLVRLEQQINNLANMNLPQQVSDLQQQLAQLRGQLQVQAHDLKLLNSQQRSFYQDLDQRITQLKNLNPAGVQDNNAKPSANLSANGDSIRLKDSGAYQSAFSLLSKKQYDKSQAAFQGYLNDYPNGEFVANAHYWLGEIYLTQHNITKASDEFQTVVDKFPQSTKRVDAQLKLAIIHAGHGKVEQARSELMKIKQQHPNSTAAQLASIRLQQLDAHVTTKTKAKAKAKVIPTESS